MQFNPTDERSESSQQEKKDQEQNLQQERHHNHNHHQSNAPPSHDDSTTLYYQLLPHDNDDHSFQKPSLLTYRNANNQARQIMASASTASPMQFAPATSGSTMSHSTSSTPTQPSTEIFQPYNNTEYQLQAGGGSLPSPANTIPSYTVSSSASQQQQALSGQGLGHQRSSSTSSMHPPPQYASRPRVTTMLWEDEGTLCFQVEAKGICVARREDNDMINGTKLLNLAGLTRGRRDGILKTEKVRHVVKVGAMHLKGVWIPFERALEFANKEKITDMLHPLFVYDLKSLLYNPTSDFPRSLPAAEEEPASTAAAAAAAAEETIKSAQGTPSEGESAVVEERAPHDDRQYRGGDYSFVLSQQSSQSQLPSMPQQTSEYSNTQTQQPQQQQHEQQQQQQQPQQHLSQPPQPRSVSPSNAVTLPSQNHPSSYTYDFRMQLPNASYMPMYRNPAPVNAPLPSAAQPQLQMAPYYQSYQTDQQALPQMHMPMYQHAAPPSGPPPHHPSHQQHLHQQIQQPLQPEYHNRSPSAPISRIHSPTLPLHQQSHSQQEQTQQHQPQSQQEQQQQPAMHYYSHPTASSHSLESNAGLYDERPTIKRMKSDH